MPATTSGRVTESTSLQPWRPSKSRTVRSPASCIRCSVVPMAPSKTTTPRAIKSRRFLSAIRSRAPYHAPRRGILASMESLEHRSAADEVRAERARAEEYKALLAQRDTELESSRARLLAAESKLVETARAIYSATKHAARQAD